MVLGNFAQPQRDILLGGEGGGGFINHEWEAILKLDYIAIKEKILEREHDAIISQIKGYKLSLFAIIFSMIGCTSFVVVHVLGFQNLLWIAFGVSSVVCLLTAYLYARRSLKEFDNYQFLQSGNWTNSLRLRMLELEKQHKII